MTLKIQNLPPRPKKPKTNPYLKNGILISPPRKTAADIEAEKKLKEKKLLKKQNETYGLITFKELYSGEYWAKKEKEDLKKQRRKEMFVQKKQLEKEKKEQMILE